MAIRSGFYNSVAGDKRKYFNEDMSRLIHLLINDGVFQNFENQFLVHPGNGLEVIVASGLGWFNNHWIHNDNDYVIKLGAAPIVTQYKRIDSIVIKMDDSLNVRDGKILCIQGTPSEVPSPPRLVDSEDVHYHKLADVLVGANVTSIIASNITNYVGTTTTPFITGILKTIDITTLIDQWHDQFERWNSAEQQAFLNWATNEQNAFIDWFNRMKDQLTEDAAGRLQTEVDDVRGQIHTNLLNPTLETTTINGITCTNNGDGTYTLNGTCTAFSDIRLSPWGINQYKECLKLKTGKYKLTGTPTGIDEFHAHIGLVPNNGVERPTSYYDDGNGYTLNHTDESVRYEYKISVNVGAVLNNVTFKPMLTTDLSADYDSFVKYSGSEERLNEQVASLHESSKGVITNLLDTVIKAPVTTNGVTCTPNGDGTFTLSGTASAETTFNIITWGTNENTYIVKDGVNKLRLVGCPKGGSSTTYKIQAFDKNASGNVWAEDTGNGKTIDTVDGKFTAGVIRIEIKSGVTCNNLLFKPMLTTDLDATYNDYVPYSGDGRLNENVAALFDIFHPIGTLYESVNKDFNPNTARGWHGTWERIKDRFIYACGDSGEPGELGGSNTHTIASYELPPHNHPIPALTGTATGGNHTHKTFAKATSYGNDWNVAGGQLTSASTGQAYWNSETGGSGNLSLTVKTNAANTSNNATYNSPIDIRPAFIRAYIWKRVS